MQWALFPAHEPYSQVVGNERMLENRFMGARRDQSSGRSLPEGEGRGEGKPREGPTPISDHSWNRRTGRVLRRSRRLSQRTMKAGVKITQSIRWRLQIWLAFLLVCVLSGFGVTVYQLQRVNQLRQIDEELERRVAALDRAVRGGPPPDFGRGRPPFDGRPGESGFDDGVNRPPPHGRPEFLPPGAGPEMHSRPREIRLTPEVSSLFDDARTNSFY